MEALRSRIIDLEIQVMTLKAGLDADLAIIRAHKDAKISELTAEIRDLGSANHELRARIVAIEGQMARLTEKVNDLFEAVYLRLHSVSAVVATRK